MNYFFTDLDNTLIYSHRHFIGDRKRLAERLNGKEQSFMTEETWEFFRRQRSWKVIPVTTRTPGQYSRLEGLAEELGWEEALILNGAVRLVRGREDPAWRKESERMAAVHEEALRSLQAAVKEKVPPEDIVSCDPFQFYVRSRDTGEVFRWMRENSPEEHLHIYRDARKVYCIPACFEKGNAIKRYRKRTGGALCVSAGDSDFDRSMLQETEIAFSPAGVFCRDNNNKEGAGSRAFPEGQEIPFSDRIVRELLRIENR